MALTSDGKLYGWGWNKVVTLICFLFSKLVSMHHNIIKMSASMTINELMVSLS